MPIPASTFAIAAQAGHAVAQSQLATALGLCTVIADAADRVQVNRRLALALSQRIDGMTSAIASALKPEDPTTMSDVSLVADFSSFEQVLHEVHEELRSQGEHSYLSQLLHQKRDRDCIDRLAQSVQHAFDILTVKLRLRTHAMASALSTHIDEMVSKHQKYVEEHSASGRETLLAASLPPRPQLHFGRATELQTLVDTLAVSENAGRIAILGGPGMGKTTLATGALHHPDIVKRYGDRRYFVACDAAEGMASAFRLLAEAFGITVPDEQSAQRALLNVLHGGGKPVLVVLDNFESAWEAPVRRGDAEQVLQLLDSVDTLSILVTMRGTEMPQGMRWSRPFLPPLSPLDDAAAKQTFLSIADVADSGMQTMDRLLGHLDNVPLALVLMANLAQYEPLDVLLKRWDELQTSMLGRGNQKTRLTSLDASISLSLHSPRLKDVPAALTLLSTLCLLPCGAAAADIALWGVPDCPRALAVLLRTALATRADQRISVLAPIRTFVLAQHPPSETALSPVYDHFFGLADVADKATLDGFEPDALAPILPELSNIDAMARYAFEHSPKKRMSAVKAALCLCDVHDRANFGPGPDILDSALAVARENRFGRLEAQLLHRRALMAAEGAVSGDTKALLEESRDMCRRLDNPQGEVTASLLLMRFMEPEDAVAEGRRLYTLAETHQHLIEMADSHYEIGLALTRDGKPSQSIPEYQKAISVLERITEPGKASRTIAGCTFRIATCYSTMGDYTRAIATYLDALVMYKALQFPSGIAHVYAQLASISLHRGRVHDAIDYASSALTIQGYTVPLRSGVRSLLNLAMAHSLIRNYDGATAALARMGEFEPLDGFNPSLRSEILEAHGIVALYCGDAEEARAYLEEARSISRRADSLMPWQYRLLQEADIMLELSEVEWAAGNLEEAATLATCAAVALRSRGKAGSTSASLLILADAVDDDLAEVLLETIFVPLHREGSARGLAYAFIRYATIAQNRGERETSRKRAQKAIEHFGEVKEERRLEIARQILEGCSEEHDHS